MPPIRTNDDTPPSDGGNYCTADSRQGRSQPGKPYLSFTAALTPTCSGRGSTGSSRETSPTVFSGPSEASSSSESKTKKSWAGVTADPIIVSGITLHPTLAFDTFWKVAAERKAVDDRRRAGEPAP
jgi:hypothetical protein